MKKTLLLWWFAGLASLFAQKVLIPPLFQDVMPMENRITSSPAFHLEEAPEIDEEDLFLWPPANPVAGDGTPEIPADSSWSVVTRFFPLEGKPLELFRKAGQITEIPGQGEGCIRYGVVDTSGVMLIPADFLSLAYGDGLALVSLLTKKGEIQHALRRRDGKLLMPPAKTRFELVPGCDGSLVLVRDEAVHAGEDGEMGGGEGRTGLMTSNGKWAIPMGRIAQLGRFSEGMASFMDPESGHYGYLNTDGRIVIPARFSYAEPFSGGKAQAGKPALLKSDGWDEALTDEIYLDKNGQILPGPAIRGGNWDSEEMVSFDLTEAEEAFFQSLHLKEYYIINDSLVRIVSLHEKVGLMHRNGRLLVSPGYDALEVSEEGHMFVATSEERGTAVMFNGRGELVVKPGRYASIEEIPGSYLWKVTSPDGSGNMGLINLLGQEVLPLRYVSCVSLQPGMVLLDRVDHKELLYYAGVGKTDTFLSFEILPSVAGKKIFRFSKPERMGKFGVCDGEGNILVPNVFEDIQCQGSWLICHRDDHTHALYTADGTLLLEGAYEAFMPWTRHHVWVRQDGKWGLVKI